MKDRIHGPGLRRFAAPGYGDPEKCRVTHVESPHYPPSARAGGVQGKVMVSAQVENLGLARHASPLTLPPVDLQGNFEHCPFVLFAISACLSIMPLISLD